MKSKQTAVEWLVNELEAHHVFHDIKNTGAFQIAKQMEKEQIVEFASSYGYAISANGHNQDIIEKFYNQEYGKE